MSSQSHQVFVLDANVFIGAHRTYYALDFCPGFWKYMIQQFHSGRLLSIDKVRNEIYNISDPTNPDALFTWTKAAPNGLFAFSGDQQVASNFASMMAWVNGNSQFFDEAKAEFASVADGWLIAYAQVHNAVVVTQEVLRPDIRKKVPIPNVCEQFNVPYLNTWKMLRQLGVRFDLRPTT